MFWENDAVWLLRSSTLEQLMKLLSATTVPHTNKVTDSPFYAQN